MFDRYLFIAATALIGASAPASAAVQAPPRPATPQARPAPAAQPAVTRATLLRNLDSNFKSLDTNGDGTLNQAELAAGELKGLQTRVAAMRSQVEAQFNKLDTNRDGQLSKVEFMAAAPQQPGPGAVTGANVLAALDKNKDGKVTADEFRSPMLTRFDRIDTNKDGTISPAEHKAAQTAQAARSAPPRQ